VSALQPAKTAITAIHRTIEKLAFIDTFLQV
jgi:hypothetical protein